MYDRVPPSYYRYLRLSVLLARLGLRDLAIRAFEAGIRRQEACFVCGDALLSVHDHGVRVFPEPTTPRPAAPPNAMTTTTGAHSECPGPIAALLERVDRERRG